MGTDISIRVERLSDGEWHKVLVSLPEPRNYGLFAMLAGVSRDWREFDPIDVPRGLPDDVSREIRAEIDAMGNEARCVSYLTFDELKNWDWAGKQHDGVVYSDLVSDFLPEALETLASLGGDATSIRLVFYFDNAETTPWTDS